MTTLTTSHKPTTVHPMNGGIQYLFRFPNGYGASVINSPYSYGGADGLWELGVLAAPDWRLTYDTPITSDVLGYLNDVEVQDALDRIAALPEKG